MSEITEAQIKLRPWYVLRGKLGVKNEKYIYLKGKRSKSQNDVAKLYIDLYNRAKSALLLWRWVLKLKCKCYKTVKNVKNTTNNELHTHAHTRAHSTHTHTHTHTHTPTQLALCVKIKYMYLSFQNHHCLGERNTIAGEKEKKSVLFTHFHSTALKHNTTLTPVTPNPFGK